VLLLERVLRLVSPIVQDGCGTSDWTNAEFLSNSDFGVKPAAIFNIVLMLRTLGVST
jgi:hypothetical protein